MSKVSVIIYTKENCPNCEIAKQILSHASMEYIDVDIMRGSRLQNFLAEYPDARQMPQIFINDQRVGGLEGLKVALGKLGVLV
jgi:glutaredoxin 3